MYATQTRDDDQWLEFTIESEAPARPETDVPADPYALDQHADPYATGAFEWLDEQVDWGVVVPPPPPEEAPLPATWHLRAGVVLGWLIVMIGLGTTGYGVAMAVDAHNDAAVGVAAADERLDAARIAIGTLSLTSAAAADAIGDVAVDVDELAVAQAEADRAAGEVAAAADGAGFQMIRLQYPVPGNPVTGVFGICRDGCSRRHEGVDMNAAAWTPILAVSDGVVAEAGWISRGAGYGVIIDHENGWSTKYFHMPTAELPVAVGQEVAMGDTIGWVGNTGNSARPHLHFEVEVRGINIDPLLGFTYLGVEGPIISTEPDPNSDDSGAVVEADVVPEGDIESVPGPEEVIETVEEDLAIARSLIDSGEVGSGAIELMAEAQATASAALEKEREMLLKAGGLVAIGIVAMALGRLAVRNSRSRLELMPVSGVVGE